MGMRKITSDQAAQIIDSEIRRISEQRGLPYSRAMGLLRDERPALFSGFYRVYHNERLEPHPRPEGDK